MAQHPISDQIGNDGGLTQGEKVAAACAVGWVIIVVTVSWATSGSPGAATGPRWLLGLIAAIVPAALIWVAASAARTARTLRGDLLRLQSTVDGIRQMQMAQSAQQPQAEPAVEKRLAEIAESTKNTETAVSRFASRREVSRLIVPRAAPQAPADQPALALGTSAEDMNPPLQRPDLIQALNFPDDENDTEGFDALRRALRDRSARRLVQASQDVLTLLSQDGVYMDDLRPSPVSADLWRRFAKGERGKDMDRLGAIRDRSSLALAAGRMREDTIFRDSVHHFLRRYDEMLVTFEENATDTDLLELAETRTSRAFMVLARATGTFD